MPPELARETEAYAVGHDAGLRYGPGGDLSTDGLETEPGAQRAGAVVPRALFLHTGDIAGASRDTAPAGVRRRW